MGKNKVDKNKVDTNKVDKNKVDKNNADKRITKVDLKEKIYQINKNNKIERIRNYN